MKVVYVAGPFTGPTAWDIECNIRRAEAWALRVAQLGAAPLCPHTNSRFFHGQLTAEFWYNATYELLSRCDGALFIDGWKGSKGSVAEYEYCHRHDLPVFFEPQMFTAGTFAHWVHNAKKEAETER